MAMDFGKLNFAVGFNRTSAFPLDANSYFENYADALAAASGAAEVGSSDSAYYIGQILIVNDKSETDNKGLGLYQITASKTLVKFGQASSADELGERVSALESQITTINGKLILATADKDGLMSKEDFAKLTGIAAGAQVNVIEGVAAKTTADSGFVDLEVVEKKVKLDLSAFATKADVSAIPKFAIEVVAVLPTENISETTVYLVNHGHGDKDIYDEWIYVNSTWEKIGNTDVDLTAYLKSADAATTYLTKTDAGTTYATKQEVEGITTNLETNYVTKTALDGKGYITSEALKPYATTESVTAAIGTAKTELQTEIDKKQTADEVKQIIAESTIAGSKVQGNVAQATLADKVAHTLTAGAKTFNGSADVEITAADIGALTEISVATDGAVGGFKTGYASTATNRAVQIDAETKTAFVNIPAAMTYAAGAGLSLTDGTFAIKDKGVTDAMINSVNVDKLTQTAGTYLTLNGGNAALA